ncbi:MAG: molybdopterin cofactor-binding domain-containing protein [Thermodesulfobacteriota bacterium]
MPEQIVDLQRRYFLKVSALAGVGLLVGCGWGAGAPSLSKAGNKRQALVPNAWIRIGEDDLVTVMVKHSEMGQGITTASAMIVAEELEVDWQKVRAEIAPADPAYKNPAMGIQATGGSTGVHTSWEVLRQAAAATRELLVAAAASTWGVAAKECRAVSGTIVHQPTSRSLRYRQLLEKAATLPLPQNPALKSHEQFKVIGKPFPRLDTRAKVYGFAEYGTDVRVPGMLTATVIHPPVLGGRVKSIDASEALKMPGVRHVLPITAGVAVVADDFWRASKAAEAVKVSWDAPEENLRLSTERIRAHWADLAKTEGKRVRDQGSVDSAFAAAAKIVEAVYELPFQAHGCPEPMNCTVQIHDGVCDIWVPTQNQGSTQAIAAKVAGLGVDAVRVHTTFLGGGFGRRFSVDFVAEAVELAKQMKAPVKVIWSREEDIRNDHFRPASYQAVRAALAADGAIKAFWHRLVGPNEVDSIVEILVPAIIPDWVPRPIKNGASKAVIPVGKYAMSAKYATTHAGTVGYAIDNVRVEYINDNPGVPVGPWRAVYNTRHAFVVESFMDEIAAASGKDPFQMRYDLLKNAPKLRTVLELAATKAGWGTRLPEGIHRGIALDEFDGTSVAMVAEVSVNGKGVVKVHRIVAAVDCGTVINPKIVEAQISGGIAFGLTATIKSAITIKDGRAEQGNFHDFPLLRMNEMPEVEVYTVPSTAAPTGIGEIGVPPVAPAVANAVAAATGKRVRSLPIRPRDLI